MKPTKRQSDPLGRSKTPCRYSRYALCVLVAITGSVWPIQARSIQAIFDTIDTRALSVCYFGSSDVLLASSWLEGDAAAQLVTKLNGAGPGANPDVPESQCARTEDVPPVDAMLIAQGTQERAIVEVSFAGCTNRGLRNGRDTSRVSPDLLQAIMEPLHTGYGFSPL